MKDCNCNPCEACEGRNSLIYSIYEKGGVVKAELKQTRYDAIRTINNLWRRADMKILGGCYVNDCAYLEEYYKGRAKVNKKDGDSFNEAIGIELARGKTLHKYHKAYDARICAMLADARSLVATIEHYCNKKSIDTEKVPSIEEIKVKRFSGK